jgi:hypothetical protein
MLIPKYLTLLTETTARNDGNKPVAIELLKYEHTKPTGGPRIHLSLAEVILTINVPRSAIGRGDAIFLLEALASAVRKEPPDQLALPGFSRADPAFVSAEKRTLPLEPRAESAPASVSSPSASEPNNAGLHDARAIALEPPPMSPPRGRKPKPGTCAFLVVGSSPQTEIIVPTDGLMRKWLRDGCPNDRYAPSEVLEPWSPGEQATVAESTQVVYAGTLCADDRALWLADEQYSPALGLFCHVLALGRREPIGLCHLHPPSKRQAATPAAK